MPDGPNLGVCITSSRSAKRNRLAFTKPGKDGEGRPRMSDITMKKKSIFGKISELRFPHTPDLR